MKSKTNKPKIGRPTKLTKELLDAIVQYLDEYEPWYECQVEKQDSKGTVTTSMKRLANPPPSILALHSWLREKHPKITPARSKLYEYNDKDQAFRDIFKRAQHLKRDCVCQNALTGQFNPIFAKFYLANETRADSNEPLMRDEKHIDHTSKGKRLMAGLDLSKVPTEKLESVMSVLSDASITDDSGDGDDGNNG